MPAHKLYLPRRAVIPPSDYDDMHAHDFAEIFWVCKGAGRHRINGQELTVLQGDLCMIRPFVDTHELKGRVPDFTIVNIAFPAIILKSIKNRYFKSMAFWGGADLLPGLYHLTDTEQQWLNAAAEEMIHAPQERLVLDRFLLNLLGSTGKSLTDPYRACPRWLHKACKEIHHPENIQGGLKTFFRLAARSREHVARTLKQYTGKTPTDVINEARIAYAAAQLLNSSFSIIEVAFNCGYSSLSYFYAMFAKKFGMTPRRYRQTYFKTPVQRLLPEIRN